MGPFPVCYLLWRLPYSVHDWAVMLVRLWVSLMVLLGDTSPFEKKKASLGRQEADVIGLPSQRPPKLSPVGICPRLASVS